MASSQIDIGIRSRKWQLRIEVKKVGRLIKDQENGDIKIKRMVNLGRRSSDVV